MNKTRTYQGVIFALIKIRQNDVTESDWRGGGTTGWKGLSDGT